MYSKKWHQHQGWFRPFLISTCFFVIWRLQLTVDDYSYSNEEDKVYLEIRIGKLRSKMRTRRITKFEIIIGILMIRNIIRSLCVVQHNESSKISLVIIQGIITNIGRPGKILLLLIVRNNSRSLTYPILVQRNV